MSDHSRSKLVLVPHKGWGEVPLQQLSAVCRLPAVVTSSLEEISLRQLSAVCRLPAVVMLSLLPTCEFSQAIHLCQMV